jgi:hypothetical protein
MRGSGNKGVKQLSWFSYFLFFRKLFKQRFALYKSLKTGDFGVMVIELKIILIVAVLIELITLFIRFVLKINARDFLVKFMRFFGIKKMIRVHHFFWGWLVVLVAYLLRDSFWINIGLGIVLSDVLHHLILQFAVGSHEIRFIYWLEEEMIKIEKEIKVDAVKIENGVEKEAVKRENEIKKEVERIEKGLEKEEVKIENGIKKEARKAKKLLTGKRRKYRELR